MKEWNIILPTENNVKLLGRTYCYEDSVWCTMSASGIEFTMTGTQCQLVLVGDEEGIKARAGVKDARVAVYLNDEIVADIMIIEKEQLVTVFESKEPKTVTIRVVKLSEAADSVFGIHRIRTDATEIFPTPKKKARIEYIGDSITCGYGVDGNLGELYATSNENATKTYAYLSAKEVDADYSMVSYSGYGIVSGWTGDGTIQEQSRVPLYYTKLAHSFDRLGGIVSPDEIEWEFSKFVPDIIVINLGTNDASYCGTDAKRGAAYQEQYQRFLEVVRKHNPNAVIVCSLGIMGDTMYPYLEAAVNEYSSEWKDTKIQTFHFTEQKEEDGYVVDGHPSSITHQKAAKELVPILQEILSER